MTIQAYLRRKAADSCTLNFAKIAGQRERKSERNIHAYIAHLT
jgi:hypothetical protein